MANRANAAIPLTRVRTFQRKATKGSVYCGEALDFLNRLRAETGSVVFLDPPFNLGKTYAHSNPGLDLRSEDEYEGWLRAVVSAASRVLMPGGTLFLYHLPRWAMRLGAFLDDRLDFRHWIAVSMKNRFARGKRLYPAHYALLMYSKGDPAHFTRPRMDPAKCRHCGGYIKDYGGYRSIIDEKGVNLSDIWDDLSPVRHAKYKHREANELPTALFERVLEISGAPGQLYVDPFAGSGSGVVCAAKAGLRFACCDIVEENCDLICSRVSAVR